MAKKKTQEQIDKERKQEELGNEFIRQREQRAAQLAPKGGDTSVAQRQAAKEISARNEEQQIGQRQEEAKQEIIQQEGALEEPQRVELNIPNVQGPLIDAFAASWREQGKIGERTREQIRALPEQAKALPENERGAFIKEEGLRLTRELSSKSHKEFIRQGKILFEGIPFLSKTLRRWKVGISKLPADDVDKVVKRLDIDVQREIDTNLRDAAFNPNAALNNLREVEQEIFNIEKRIQELLIFSPTLRSEPLDIDEIESQILAKRDNLRSARIAIASISAAPQ